MKKVQNLIIEVGTFAYSLITCYEILFFTYAIIPITAYIIAVRKPVKTPVVFLFFGKYNILQSYRSYNGKYRLRLLRHSLCNYY